MTLRIRIFVTPILVYFTSLLVIAMVMVPPMAPMARAVSLGAIGCAGIAYVMNLHCCRGAKAIAHGEGKPKGRRLFWDVLLPLASYALTVMAAVAWALEASFANSYHRHRRGDPADDGAAQELDRDACHRHRAINPRPKKRRGDPIGRHASLSLVGREARSSRDRWSCRRGLSLGVVAPCPIPASMPASFSDT